MQFNQSLQHAVNEMDSSFVEEIRSCTDVPKLRAQKNRTVDPDKRELIQSRMDNLYRQSL